MGQAFSPMRLDERASRARREAHAQGSCSGPLSLDRARMGGAGPLCTGLIRLQSWPSKRDEALPSTCQPRAKQETMKGGGGAGSILGGEADKGTVRGRQSRLLLSGRGLVGLQLGAYRRSTRSRLRPSSVCGQAKRSSCRHQLGRADPATNRPRRRTARAPVRGSDEARGCKFSCVRPGRGTTEPWRCPAAAGHRVALARPATCAGVGLLSTISGRGRLPVAVHSTSGVAATGAVTGGVSVACCPPRRRRF